MRSFYVIKSGPNAYWKKRFVFVDSLDEATRFFSHIECENILANLQKKCPICDYEMVVQQTV